MSDLRKVTTTAAVVALLAGCAPSARPAVQYAAARWYEATGLEMATEPAAIREAWGPFGCGRATVTGCYDRNHDTITIDMRRPLQDIERTATHEYGHRLGLPEGGVSIMGYQQSTPWSYCISDEDVFLVCLLHECRWERPECVVVR